MENSIEMVLHKSKILKYLTKEFPEVPVTVYKNYIKVPGVPVPKKHFKNLRITLRVPGVPEKPTRYRFLSTQKVPEVGTNSVPGGGRTVVDPLATDTSSI